MREELSFIPRLRAEVTQAYREPLTPTVKRALLALVIFFHVGGGWALTQVEPVKLIVGDIAPLEVRMVPAEQPTPPDLPFEEPPPPPDPKPPPELATMVEPPPPDLPPPEFPMVMPELPPPPDMPEPTIPVERPPEPPKPKPAQKRPPVPQAPVDAQPQQAAPAAPAAPRTVSASQLGYLVPPNPIYPPRSRKAGEQGVVMVRVLIDVTGRPAQVSLHQSCGHPTLDESALSAVRAAQFRPYAEGGFAQAVWVLVPINFVLR